ncbi:hypothetical protein [Exiguobacterium aurantiacum]|uniref:Cysteine-rich CPCC domain-containing protein n=1 Tax=Exiguobacterium aurantiacum TaxID=33987 RepID=A0ABY5FN52_9BACL|nr:hypothetical protein [Exiguobacterium aurantiacum]UTT42925.1 hypothetical protein NMQ00_15635 [Exiguobacterium aurantiacum]
MYDYSGNGDESMTYVCPVCGFDGLDEPAYNKFNDPSFEICLCCQFQFGDDDDIEIEEGLFMQREETHTNYRKAWIESGAPIFQTEYYPKQFQYDGAVTKKHLIEQLKNIHIFEEQ